MYKLRNYQQEAVDISIDYLRKNTDPCLLELATGAGKSIICAEIAKVMHEISGKKVLCLCPKSELVEQNYEKFLLTGYEASIYSASISKSLRHNVVFATEGTFKSVALGIGHQYSTVSLDEAHRITPTIKKIISDMREGNPNLRILGMTGTPYRMFDGYIYELDESGMTVDEAIKPYFKKLLYRVTGSYLTSVGFLCPIVRGEIHAENYNTDRLELSKTGLFTQQSIDEAFVGKGTKTSEIVFDVVGQANARNAESVMLFASCVDHAKEIMESLPAYNSALVIGSTPKKERRRIVREYKVKNIRFLVNIGVFTTGFDCTSISIIALLRKSESASLIGQMNGRGARLDDCKTECLILDYAGNLDYFFPDGDLYNPQIQSYGDKPKIKADFTCPQCSSTNTFTLRPNPDGMAYDDQGYFLTISGERYQPLTPAHYGRRCTYVEAKGRNVFERCSHFWECKICDCGQDNDIAARKCSACKALLIDYNDKLVGGFLDFKNDLSQVQTDAIEWFSKKTMSSKQGNPMLRVVFNTKFRQFVAFFSTRVNRRFYELMSDPSFKPKTVSYKKSTKTEFFTVVDFDRNEDVAE